MALGGTFRGFDARPPILFFGAKAAECFIEVP
jgi:hypothetical protein